MKSSKDQLSTISGFMRKTQVNQKIVKASDIKLNDVLINGVKLRCFKAIKKKILLSEKRRLQSQYLIEQGDSSRNQVLQTQDETLFKNNAIKKILKSLQNHQNQAQDTSLNSFRMKKISFSPKQTNKFPIDILKPINQQRYKGHQQMSVSSIFSDNLEVVDINNKFYSLLKKEITMYSTNNRFNSVIAKSNIHFSKYVGLNAGKLKKKLVDPNSLLKQKIIYKQKINEQPYRYQSLNTKKSERLSSDESKKSLLYVYKTLIDEQKQQNQEQNNNQKMKICFSRKNNFKRWRDLMNEKTKDVEETHRSKRSQANPDQNQSQIQPHNKQKVL